MNGDCGALDGAVVAASVSVVEVTEVEVVVMVAVMVLVDGVEVSGMVVGIAEAMVVVVVVVAVVGGDCCEGGDSWTTAGGLHGLAMLMGSFGGASKRH